MDRAISASEANQHFSEMLRDVQQGDAFVVISRGRPVARVSPIETAPSAGDVVDLLGYLEALPNRTAKGWRREDLYR